jgi:hypothetical protein
MSASETNADPASAPTCLVGDREAYCRRCFYPLRGLTTPRCPECGAAFDPSNPRTLWLGQPIGRWLRWTVAGPGWLYYTSAGLATVWILGAATLPYAIAGELSAICTALVFGGLWVVRLLVALIATQRWHGTSKRCEWHVRRWLAAPALALLVAALLSADTPARVRFWFARPALDRFVQQITQPGAAVPQTARVGGYQLEEIVADPNGVHFYVHGALFRGGFWYRPQCTFDNRKTLLGKHVSGDWYYCVECWHDDGGVDGDGGR